MHTYVCTFVLGFLVSFAHHIAITHMIKVLEHTIEPHVPCAIRIHMMLPSDGSVHCANGKKPETTAVSTDTTKGHTRNNALWHKQMTLFM